MIVIEIKNCNDCTNHEIHGIYTEDTFENEQGIYCSKVEDSSDSWERYTYDGHINKKLVHSYDTWESEKAAIPSWCPLLIDSYKRIIEDISRSPRQPIEKIDKNTIELASCIIEMLGEVVGFDDYAYQGGLHYGSTERDLCLIEIAQLCKSQFMVNEKEDIEKLGLNKEDTEIIKTAIKPPTDDNVKKLIQDFSQVKKEAKGTMLKPILQSEIAVPAALYLADMMARARYYYTELDLSFEYRGKNENDWPLPVETAEIRYTAETYVENHHIDYVDWALNGEEKNSILRQKLLLEKIFGIKTYKYYINETRIPINKIKKK